MKNSKNSLHLFSRYGWLFIFLFFIEPSSSQVHFGIGLRTQLGGMQAYKDVKGHYDDMRPWLSNKMGNSGGLIGLELGLESSQEKYGLAFAHIYLVGSNSTASGTNSGQNYTRKIKARMWGIETIDAWYTPFKIGKFNLGAGVMPFGLGVFRISTRLNNEDKVRVPLSDLQNKLNYSFTKTNHMYAQFHLDITRVRENSEGSLHFQFFYTLGPKREYDLYYLNKEINPNTYATLYKRTMLKVNNFGFKLTLSI